MKTARYEPFTAIHKALRRQLFETAIALGRTDFAAPDERAAAARAVEACNAFLREHAEHEDHHVVTTVLTFAPELATELDHEHVSLERAAIAVESLFPRFAALDAESCHALGGEVSRRFLALVAQQIHHMAREEHEVTALLWDHLDDAALEAITGRILADIPPARMAEWGAVIAPAINRREREGQKKGAEAKAA
ncbi:MAG TPA: hypothetical protein VHJ20_11670 [Polyangia bacterium]|nr:hypothetical protein [Polyangia bacterium]